MEYDEKIGYGSNYEKVILQNIFAGLIRSYNLESILEYPANNLMGEHKEIFREFGMKINPKEADLVWNFCEFEQSDNPNLLIEEMMKRSKKYLLLVTGNYRNIGVGLHRLWHLATFKKWDHGRFWQMSYGKVKKELNKFNNLETKKIGAFDIPWFVLDVYECGNFLKKLVPSKGTPKEIKPTAYEKYPFFWKKNVAHHFYLLIEKK